MKWYLDITLIPDSEIPIYFLWEKIYSQLHFALVESAVEGKQTIGVSFPEYRSDKLHPLGQKLRLHARNQDTLNELDLEKYFNRLSDYVHRATLKEIPTDKISGYACFKRVTTKGNVERLARRRGKKLNVSYEQALDYFINDKDRKQSENIVSKAPFIYLNSETTKQRFPLFIVMEIAEGQTEKLEFSTYGLSAICSVPLF